MHGALRLSATRHRELARCGGLMGVEDMPGAPSGQRVLVQRTTENAFNVIVAPSGPYTDMDVSVRFKPMAGPEDVSGGIVFRRAEGQCSVVRVNALEDNFRLYAYDRGRHQLATARGQLPALGQWHTIRVVAVGEPIQASLNGVLLPGASGCALWHWPGRPVDESRLHDGL